VKRVALYAAALGFMAFAGFPFYWMLITAFKQNRDLYVGAFDTRHVPWIFNDPPTLDTSACCSGRRTSCAGP